jgi:ankyrin repeat protein
MVHLIFELFKPTQKQIIATDHTDNSPYSYALYSLSRIPTPERLEIVKLFMDKQEMDYESNAARWSAITGNKPVEESEVNKPDFWGLTPLHWAAIQGNVRGLSSWIGKANVDAVQNDTLYTPLVLAFRYGNKTMIRFLIQTMHADINVSFISGLTILTKLLDIGDVPRSKALIEAGADVNKRGTHYGVIISPLSCSIKLKHLKSRYEMTSYLISKGAKLDTFNQGQCFHSIIDAVDKNDIKLIILLLGAGADVNAYMKFFTYQFPRCSLDIACQKRNLPMIKLLRQAGAQFDPCTDPNYLPIIGQLAFAGRFQDINFFLDQGANINAVYLPSRTSPLQFTTRTRHYSTMALLIARGADINAADIYMHSLLMNAEHFNNIPMRYMLLGAGAK